ncbi:MAG TPA: hypothetical protein VNG31_03585, partial [Candidatus Baltobacteraceae bacterium]|nr:hypothetical protein [Candidatus Baltobacteraceae bacterium]
MASQQPQRGAEQRGSIGKDVRMLTKAVAPYGLWPSPVSADLVAGATVTFAELAVDGAAVTWLELRPAERGRRALVRWSPGGEIRDLLPQTSDVGTRVHELGGG